jgi:hypothetical protein
MVRRVCKQIVLLNLCLALVTVLASAWLAQSVGSSAYLSGGLAMLVVGLAASLALLIAFFQSQFTQQTNGASHGAVSAMLLGMLVRMGLPLGFIVVMTQTANPLLESGLLGLLVLNYLVALPLETFLSLQFLRSPQSSVASPLS